MLSEFFLYYVAVLLVVAAITYLAYGLYSSGYLDAVEASAESLPHREFQVTVQTPALFSHDSDVVVFYKHFVGPYRRIGKISNDVVDILPRGQARIFTIYYDPREQHNSKNSQAAVGCIYQVDGIALFEKHFEYQLIRWGFEKMTLPRVKKAVNFRTRFASGIFTTLLLDNKAYPKMRQLAHNLGGGDCPLSIEVISSGGAAGGGSVIDAIIPLDHRDEFLVPEYLSSAELRSKMDDSSSCASDLASAEQFGASDEGESETDAVMQE